MPKVSIIIPIYNTHKYLERCMDSVLNQTLQDIEIILVDDESPDDSPRMCDEYAKADTRIKVIHKKNGGLGFARNSGIEIATGEYIAFLDSDDYVDETMYQKLYEEAKRVQADTCLCGHTNVDKNNQVVNKYYNPFGGKVFRPEQTVTEVLANVLGTMPEAVSDELIGLPVWKAIYSMNILQENNIRFCSEREFISEDVIFHIDYYSIPQTVTCISDALYYYCENASSLSRSYKPDYFERYKKLYLEEIRRLQGIEHFSHIKCRVDRSFLMNTRVAIIHEVTELDKKSAIENIKNIINDDVLQNVLNGYPYNKNPFKYRLFNFMIAKKIATMLYIMVKIK